MARWPVDLFTGERVVVFLFVSRVLLAAPVAFLCEAFSLVMLASAALFVEIAAERSPARLRFKTRPGASSGIFLGSVTFPTVMLSQMIQLSRMLAGNNFTPEDIARYSREYWIVSASTIGVLLFLCLVLHQPLKKASPFGQGHSLVSNLILLQASLCTMACYFSSAKMSDSGWSVILDLLWLFCCGVSTIMLMKLILYKFPSCASIGEALLVCTGLILYCSNMLACTLAKIPKIMLSSTLSFAGHEPKSEKTIVIQGMILGILLMPLFYKTVIQGVHYITLLKKPESTAGWKRHMTETLIFCGSLVVLLIILVPAWLHFVQDLHVHPVLWIFKFVFADPLKCLGLCMYWICLICFSVLRFYNISKHSKTERILLRKYYHLMAVLMFSPALLIQPDFMDLAFGTALGVFLVLEMIRIWNIWPLGHIVHHFMNAFTDHRDSEILIVSHFSLLLGCALPKWISPGLGDRPLAPFAGILSLGIGDTMASVVGYKYGVLRWSKTGKKTIEGTAAGITSVLISCSMLLPLVASTGYNLSQHWLSLLGAVTISGLLEASTAQLDNAFIPLVFYSLLCL